MPIIGEAAMSRELPGWLLPMELPPAAALIDMAAAACSGERLL